ncbi:MAG: CoA transferase [Comamonadaceae bacterium]|nr:MAG: CoA transferase [Comamonadaceae bacterium]
MSAAGALHGLKVLDISRVLAGPLSAQILADLGADVIKIERPVRGDDTREWAPPTMVSTPESAIDESVYFWSCNRGKRSVTADLADNAGRELVLRLAQQADVLIENYKVDTLSRYGLDFATLHAVNPRLIYCSITGFGQTGPYRARPGYDTIVQAIGGLMSITGNADDMPGGGPRKAGVAVSDQLTALYSAVAILAAVNERHVSGLGQQIDMSLLDVQVAALANLGVGYLATGAVPQRLGNRLSTVYPSDSFRCSDGDIMLIVGNDEQFRRFCTAMAVPGLASDVRFSRNGSRLKHADILGPLVAAAFEARTVAECQQLLDAAGVPAAPINDLSQVFEDPQVLAREMVREVTRSDGRKARILANPIRMSRSPVRNTGLPPRLGEHTEELAGGWPS